MTHGFGKHIRLLDRCLPDQVVAVLPDPLDDVHRVGVDVAVFTKPRVVAEAGDVHDEHVAVPLADGVAVGRRVRILAMRTTVGRNDAVRIAGDVLVQEDRLPGQLDDLPRRADARHARLAAGEHRVGAALVIREVLHLCLELRLEGGSRRGRLHAFHRAGVTMTGALIDLLNRDLSVDLFLERGGRAVDRVAPHAAQVGMACLLREDGTLNEKEGRNEAENCSCHICLTSGQRC